MNVNVNYENRSYIKLINAGQLLLSDNIRT